MNDVITKKAYAKINLGLKTLYKRKDNYHELEMLMINIDLYDELRFEKCDEVIVTMDNNICDMKDNIVYKMVMLLKDKYKISEGIKIDIKKNIPSGGGLGGGSSDAAVTLTALNDIWNLKLDSATLNNLASIIGSDVPFFLYNRLSFVKGRGEIVESVNKNMDTNIILVFPNIKCDTKEIYKNHVIKENDDRISNIINCDNTNYYKYLFNDLEETVKKVYNNFDIDGIKENLLKCGCKGALMSGSGSTIFGIIDDFKDFDLSSFESIYKNYKVLYCKTISSCK